MPNTYGRQVVVPLTNKSGGGVIAGDVVIVGTANNDAFTTTTSAAFTGTVGIAQETIANDATGRVLLSGYAALINTTASVTRQNYGTTSTTVKKAVDAGASRVVGTFVQFLTGGTTPDGIVYPADLGSGSGTGTVTTVKDEGSNLSTAVVSLDFVGAGVTATGTTAVTVTIPNSGALTEATLSGDVTMTTANTFYDGPTITPAAGTYDVWARVGCKANGASRIFTARLIANGSATPIDEDEQGQPTSGWLATLYLAARVVANGTDPILVRCTSANNGDIFMRDPANNSSSIHRKTLLRIQRVA